MGLSDRFWYRTSSRLFPLDPSGLAPAEGPDRWAPLYGLVTLPLLFATFFGVSPFNTVAAGTTLPYFLCFLALAAHLAAVWFLFNRRAVSFSRLAQAAFFTGIVGIAFLFFLQYMAGRAEASNDFGFFAVIFRFIAFVYDKSENPFGSSPMMTLLGFTLGVGLCEEFVKILPVLYVREKHYYGTQEADWRTLCVVGMASGVGFGIAEAVWYHEQVYNSVFAAAGQTPLNTYFLRLVEVVGGHAILSGAAGVGIARRSSREDGGFYLFRVLWACMPVIVLHGLYDTLLHMDHEKLAAIVEVLAFGWLLLQMERARRQTTDASRPLAPPQASRGIRTLWPAEAAAKRAERVDAILAKVSDGGLDSLTEEELGILREQSRKKKRASKKA